MENQLKEINLRLKQLVALKVLDSLYNCGGRPFEEKWDRDLVSYEEQEVRNEILADKGEQDFRKEFQEATRELAELRRKETK